MRIIHAAREMAGIAEAGGVKDVVSGLALAAARRGFDVDVYLPRYGFLQTGEAEAVAEFPLSVPGDGSCVIYRDRNSLPLNVYLVDHPVFREKMGVYTYTADDADLASGRERGRGHLDAGRMNLIFCRAVAEDLRRRWEAPISPRQESLSGQPLLPVLHCHDGHTAFLPVLLSRNPEFPALPAVVTIHNAGRGYHQAVEDLDQLPLYTGIPLSFWREAEIEGRVDPFLAAGFVCSLITVSPQYAREILEDAGELSDGLGPALRKAGIGVRGITNGIEPGIFPRETEDLPLRIAQDKGAKDIWAQGFLQRLGELESSGKVEVSGRPGPAGVEQGGPILAFQGRVTRQKGISLLADAVDSLIERADPGLYRIWLVGQGVPEEEARLKRLTEEQGSASILYVRGYDAELVANLFLAAHFFLVPSLFEPCGLTDLMAQLAGAVPVVHRVGGLAKVESGVTGFSFEREDPEELSSLLADLIRSPAQELAPIRREGARRLRERYTWDKVFEREYQELYRRTIQDFTEGGNSAQSAE